MKLLLLGCNGQLGSDLLRAHEADARGIEIEKLSRADLDVTELDAIAPVLAGRDFDVLINCTSYHKTDEVESNAQKAVAINAQAVKRIAQACAAKNAKLLHVSTDYVFDGTAQRPYTESDPIGPLNVYGATKAMGEALARTSCPDTVIFRVASLFGVAGASGKGGNFVETMIRFGKEKGALRVVADQVMSPTSTADLAKVMLDAIAKDVKPGVYHVVNSGQASWHEFAQRIIERAGVKATVEPIPTSAYPTPAQRPAFSVLDNTKIQKLVSPIPHWTDALDRYLQAKGHAAVTV